MAGQPHDTPLSKIPDPLPGLRSKPRVLSSAYLQIVSIYLILEAPLFSASCPEEHQLDFKTEQLCCSLYERVRNDLLIGYIRTCYKHCDTFIM